MVVNVDFMFASYGFLWRSLIGMVKQRIAKNVATMHGDVGKSKQNEI